MILFPKKSFGLIAFFLLATINISCNKSEIKYYNGSVEQLFEEALKLNKKIFILVSSSQCKRCTEFKKFLNEQEKTRAVLSNDYINYILDMDEPKQKDFAQILRCSSYPFPFFFLAKGALEAFGFPKTASYDITNLDNIKIDELRFQELFKMPISTDEYKNLITFNIKAYQILNKPSSLNSNLLDSAYYLLRQSIKIAPYPYNTLNAYIISNKMEDHNTEMYKQLLIDHFQYSDIFLYGDLRKNKAFYSRTKEDEVEALKNDFTFRDEVVNANIIKEGSDYSFRYELINNVEAPLIIIKADHPCSCVQLKWTKQAIGKDSTGIIEGIFHANLKGVFRKEIYVHTNCAKYPMKTLILKGEVQ